MTMRAISNGDMVLIQKSTLFGSMIVAKFRPDSNTMEMTDGCYKPQWLEASLKALRKYQKERHLPVVPVRVEYW